MLMDWRTTAAIFPGQGSQAVGMGADFAASYEAARDVFAQADDILGYNLSAICWSGPAAALDQTHYTQPALYVSSMAIWTVLQQQLPGAKPAWMAGHSLGELTALTAAGALSFEAGVKLVQARGQTMRQAGERYPGAMAALLALELDKVEDLCQSVSSETGNIVVLANDNCPGQAVVSGEVEAVDRLIELAAEAGARRAVKLAVSIAAHSPLMAAALEGFRHVINATTFSPPEVQIISNVNASPLTIPAEIRQELDQQLTQSVRWTDSMRALIDAGAQSFIEVGAGAVLTGLLRRIDRSKTRVNLNTVAAFERFLDSQA